MPKLKSHRGLKRRVKVTKSGKIKRHKAGKGHLLTGKSAKRRRNLRQAVCIEGRAAKKLRAVL